MYKKIYFLFLFLLFPSILMAAQAYWAVVAVDKDGTKFEVNENSILKNNGIISFEIRNQAVRKSSPLVDLFKSKQDYVMGGLVVSCSEPKFNTYFFGEADESGNVTKESDSKSIEIASLNLQPIAKDSIVYIAALKYCNADLSKRNPKNLSDISMKDPQNQNEWMFVTSSPWQNSDNKSTFTVDSSSALLIKDNVFQVSTNTILEKPVDMSGKRLKNILSSVHINCKNQSSGLEMTEYFDADGAIISRDKSKGNEPQLLLYSPNSQMGMVASYFCPKIAQFASVDSKMNPINTSSLNANNPPSKATNPPTFEPSNQGKRLALVIGNAGYKIRPLANPVNDANDISAALKRNGFEVIDIRDGNLNQMRSAIRQFGDKLIASDVGLVYYSGHGIEVKGQNYLIPVNADIKRSDEIADQSLNMSLILEKMETAKKGVNILIVDACRDDPFGRSFRSSSNGLAQVDAPRGTIVAFATSPGKVASDGDGRNSPYTKNLIKAIQMPNLPIEQVFKQVRRAVQEETKNQQTPWENTSLSGDFYFSIKK